MSIRVLRRRGALQEELCELEVQACGELDVGYLSSYEAHCPLLSSLVDRGVVREGRGIGDLVGRSYPIQAEGLRCLHGDVARAVDSDTLGLGGAPTQTIRDRDHRQSSTTYLSCGEASLDKRTGGKGPYPIVDRHEATSRQACQPTAYRLKACRPPEGKGMGEGEVMFATEPSPLRDLVTG